MERKTVPESEHKLLILDALARLGGVTSLQLLQFMVDLDLMNYFVLQLNLCELEEKGQVEVRHHATGSLYELTEKGCFTLESFEKRIPSSRRELLETEAKVWRARFRAEQQNQADAFPMKNGRQCLRLRLLEKDSALLDLSLTVEGSISESELRIRWRENAQEVYMGITRMLSDGFGKSCCPASLPSTALLQKVGEADWMLSLTDSVENPTLNLMLSLPTEELARHYASRWPEAKAEAQQEIMRTLGNH